jgi:uncharacterized RDD family membrane protein YckC
MASQNEFQKAGFWIRLLATWIDCVVIYALLSAVFYLLVYTAPSMYFPFNFTFFVTGLVYSAILIALKGQTIGKYLMGITVYNNDAGKLPVYKTLLRESIFKLISAIILFFGFFWIGFTKNKKGWHDYMVKSSVLKNKTTLKASGFWKMLALVSFLFFSINYIWSIANALLESRKMNINPASVRLPFMDRDINTVTDIEFVKDTSFVSWLDKNAQTPENYTLQVAATYQITLLGEMHENGSNLRFFSYIIPKLYQQSGTRIIAMEVIDASQNKKLEQLVNGKSYDESLALKIARHQSWGFWGIKEYWDIMKTVWQLNHDLPAGAEKMRLIGIDCDINMVNISLLGNTQDSRGSSPLTEKFRAFSVVQDITGMANRDKLMARNIEKEIINKNKKGVVLIGFNHTLLRFTSAVKKGSRIEAVNPRFGVLLSQKYKNMIFQIECYQKLDVNEENSVCNPSIDGFMDSVMKKRNNQPAGFSIIGSPFEKLRDNCSMFFMQFPSVCYGDITDGVLFLKALNEIDRGNWMPGYISDEMYMKNKPLYDLIFKKNSKIKYKNAAELNELLVRVWNENNL